MPPAALLAQLAAITLVWGALARWAPGRWRTPLVFALKLYLTGLVFAAILFHEVDGRTIHAALGALLPELDRSDLILFCAVATGVRLTGIAASITRWTLLLRGQGIALPARHIVGAFFIGRFLGTFLPSTLGLDGYKLYDAARFSGRSIEAAAATGVEKVLGVSGIFGTFLIALPIGVSVFGEYAPLITALGLPLATLPLAFVALALFWPGPQLLRWLLARLPLPTLQRTLERVADGIGAYGRRRGLLLAAWALSLVSHFMTAATYYFTARALGVQPSDAGFWQVTFASSIQIFATVISPFTIAGEGIRELAQGLLLREQMTFAVAAASGLLGFLVAEAPTLLGVIPWLGRRASYRPRYCLVDGEQVDYEESRRAAAEPFARDPGRRPRDVDPLGRRLVRGALSGLAAGLYAGLLIGFAEAVYLLLRGRVVQEAEVFWAAPAAYAALFGGAGLLGGAGLGVLPFPRAALERWVSALGLVACTVPWALVATLFFLYRDVHSERIPPASELAVAVGACAALALVLLAGALLLDRTRLRSLLRARAALPLAAVAILLGAAAAAGMGPRALREAPPRPVAEELRRLPSVVFVIVDTLRADVLPAYGGEALRTPALDRLAAEGTVFRAAFAQASWTKPSIASLLTSLYPSSHGAVHKPSRLPEGVTTLPEVLSAYGYSTCGIVTNANLAPSFNFQQGFDEYHYLTPDYLLGVSDSTARLLLYEIARRIAARASGGVRPGQAYQPAPVVNARALDWLDRHGDERFFLLLHYMEPHDPYFTHPDDGRAIARATTPSPDPALRDEIARRYRGEIEYLDAHLDELFRELEARALWDDLLVVVTSDHGEEFLDHGGWWHGLTLYDEQIGVPLLVKWPARRRAAPPRWAAQVRSIDIAPTLLAYLGAPVPPAMQGEDLLAGPRRDRPAYAEEDHEGNVLQALRTGGWKLIRANPGNPRGLRELELYQVSRDPAEQSELSESEARRAARLRGELDRVGRLARAQAQGSEVADLDRQECERLRALGYVEDCRP